MFFKIFSKSREKKRLLNNYLTSDEKKDLAINTIITIISPILFSYGFLIINDGSLVMFGSRAFFYIPFFGILLISYSIRVKKEQIFLKLAKERKENE